MESDLLSSSSSTPYLDLEVGNDFLKTSISWDDDPESSFVGPEEFGLSYDGVVHSTTENYSAPDKLEEYRLGKRSASGLSICSAKDVELASKQRGKKKQELEEEEEKEHNSVSTALKGTSTSGTAAEQNYSQSKICTNIKSQNGKNKAATKIKLTLDFERRNEAENKEKHRMTEYGSTDKMNEEDEQTGKKSNRRIARLLSVNKQTFPLKASFVSKHYCPLSFWNQENSVPAPTFSSDDRKMVKKDTANKIIDNEIEKIRKSIDTRKFFRSWVWETEAKVVNNYFKKEMSSKKYIRQQNGRLRYCTSRSQSNLIKTQPTKSFTEYQKLRANGRIYLSSSVPVISTTSTVTNFAGLAKRNATVDYLIMKHRQQQIKLVEEEKQKQQSLRAFYDSSMKITKQHLKQRYSK